MGIVYILFSKKLNKFYVGSSTDIDRRLTEHNSGKSKFTSRGMPWLLMYSEAFPTLTEAKKRELQIKKRKSRIYIEELISNTHSHS
jgi:putative endonuclease